MRQPPPSTWLLGLGWLALGLYGLWRIFRARTEAPTDPLEMSDDWRERTERTENLK